MTFIHLPTAYGALVWDGMGQFPGTLIDECQLMVNSPDPALEAYPHEVMLNPERNPQWALYKSIDSGTVENLRHAISVGADPNRLANNVVERGAALMHMIDEDNFCLEKARVLIAHGCDVDGRFVGCSLIEWAADEYLNRCREEALDPAEVFNFAKLLCDAGAKLELAGEQDSVIEMQMEGMPQFLSELAHVRLAETTQQAAATTQSRRL